MPARCIWGSALQPVEVGIWDLTKGKLQRKLSGYTSPVRQVTFSSDGTRLATADADGGVKVWDWKSGQVLFSQLAHRGAACRWRSARMASGWRAVAMTA